MDRIFGCISEFNILRSYMLWEFHETFFIGHETYLGTTKDMLKRVQFAEVA